MTDRLRLSDDVVFRELDGEAVLLNLDSGTYFGLDEVGTRFWQLIEQDGRVETALATLESEYEVAADVLRADLDRLVSTLVEKGLMVRADDAAR
jgi:Coenzyme PQQ synthesis protein D (PqqD)